MILPYSNLQLKHQNPGAVNPLILPIQLICNTSDEALYSNIEINSRRPLQWVKEEVAHNGMAVLCGSGPSIADNLDDIRWLAASGGKIFAMNGCAKFLSDNGITADYQVIIDAREETSQLVGPATTHLFASQVHPKCFENVDNIELWHLQIDNIDDYLPEYKEAYCLIGGAASVGNTATCLAYAMGYRNLQIFGYDSSHRGTEGHAFHQKMNDGDPCASVRFGNKDYIVSLTMKLQAEKFQDTAKELKQLGCKIEVHGDGLLPDMYNRPKEIMTEREKYERMWAYPNYRSVSPGELCVDTFLQVVKPSGKVIDFGCGTGRGAIKIKEYGCDVLLVDFTDNSRDFQAMVLPFLQHDLTKPFSNIYFSKYGYCTDVMEHIPTEDVFQVIENIMSVSEVVFFNISTISDVMGELIGQDLHLTVKPHQWWIELFKEMGYNVPWEEERNIASLFVIERI